MAKQEKKDITKEEQAMLDAFRAQQQAKQECTEALQAVLKKYNMQLGVDPNSPIGNPQIIVVTT